MTTDIINAFYTRLYAQFGTTTIFPAGVDVTEPDSGEWLEVAFFPGEGQPVGMAYADPVVLGGIFQVTVASKSPGVNTATALAQSVQAAFPCGAAVDAVRVSRPPYLMQPQYDGATRRIPVSIPYIT